MTKNNKIIAAIAVILVVVAGVYIYNQAGQDQVNYQSNSSSKGRIVAGITDAAADMGTISSVRLTVDKMEMHGESSGWITVSNATKEYDLLALKESGRVSLYTDAMVPVGTYDQARLSVSNVVVVANGQTQTAKLPSGSLKIVGRTVVTSEGTATLVFDFMADKSIHMTGEGKIIFTPVVKFTSESSASVQMDADAVRTTNHGKVEVSVTVGMDENGETKGGFEFDNDDEFDVEGDAIRVILKGESVAKVAASAAISAAINGGYIDSAISVKLTNYQNKLAWNVTGLKGLVLTTVYVDATTGAVITSSAKAED